MVNFLIGLIIGLFLVQGDNKQQKHSYRITNAKKERTPESLYRAIKIIKGEN